MPICFSYSEAKGCESRRGGKPARERFARRWPFAAASSHVFYSFTCWTLVAQLADAVRYRGWATGSGRGLLLSGAAAGQVGSFRKLAWPSLRAAPGVLRATSCSHLVSGRLLSPGAVVEREAGMDVHFRPPAAARHPGLLPSPLEPRPHLGAGARRERLHAGCTDFPSKPTGPDDDLTGGCTTGTFLVWGGILGEGVAQLGAGLDRRRARGLPP